jgi:hypothetical protein
MKAGPDGRWQLRAVLSVPVPGHSSPLLATAVAERSNLALAASAAFALAGPDIDPDVSGQGADTSGRATDTDTGIAPEQDGHRPDAAPDSARTPSLASVDVDAVATALLTSVPFLEVLASAMDRAQERRETAKEEAARLAASVIAPAREEIAAGNTTTEGKA